jgi:hypothetical protein
VTSVVDQKLFFIIRILFSPEFWIRIRILLDQQKVPDAVPDPVPDLFLNIYSFFSMPTILKAFSWLLKAYFSGKILD